MNTIYLIFPHQLFKEIPVKREEVSIYLIEEYLFFRQYLFHKRKIAFHRASMKYYEAYLKSLEFDTTYIESTDELSDVRRLISDLGDNGVNEIKFTDPTDCWLEKRIKESCSTNKIAFEVYTSPMFLNSQEELMPFFRSDKKKYHQTSFYKEQRKNRGILLSTDGKPSGGKWTYDTENRKKYPVHKLPPALLFPEGDHYYKEARDYVASHYSKNPGKINNCPFYPANHKETEQWLDQFLNDRFLEFGPYEDAIVKENSWLHHSVLTPMLNTGLITPKEIISHCLTYAENHDIPINSTEGFVRQIIGWREFIRGMYTSRGADQRTRNFWGFKRKIPSSFYDGSTGIAPIDITIQKIVDTGYCHHIERLMVLGNFMMLCEFDPDEVYRWFMELFIDAYDWVMVPNVYGMSQFSDGGLMASKPYISSSNYILKMSNFKKGDWQDIWDGLFWRFMDLHRDFFLSNPRLSMLVRMFDKMPVEKRTRHLENGEYYLESLKDS